MGPSWPFERTNIHNIMHILIYIFNVSLTQSPLTTLQEFSQQLDTFTSDEELLDGFEVILQNFGDYEKVYA